MELNKIPHNKLVKMLDSAPDQETKNRIAYELTKRIYIPNKQITFEEILLSFGYVYEEKPKVKSLKL